MEVLKSFLVISLCVLSLGLVDLVRSDMSVYAIAVGQGDSAIIQCPNKKDLLIVDIGASSPQYVRPEYVSNLLKERFHGADQGVNINILISHSHTDHYGYIARAMDSDLLKNVRKVILGGEYNMYSKSFRAWLATIAPPVYTINNQNKCFGNKNCTLTSNSTGQVLGVWQRDRNYRFRISDPWQFCPSSAVKFTVLGANIGNSQNGHSVILKIQYLSWSIIMSGDFEMVGPQQELIAAWPGSVFKVNYYKAAHHGAWTDKKPNMVDLLDLLQPEKIYISQGAPQLSSFHHPNSVTIANFRDLDSVATIDASTNAPFLYWDNDKQKAVTLKGGLNRAIYETCRVYNSRTKSQVCQDIWIWTDGRSDNTTYMDVPQAYVASGKGGANVVGVDV